MIIEDFMKHDVQMSFLHGNHYNVSRLIELSKDFKVMTVPLNHLNVYYTYSKLSLRDMVMHMKAINDADLSYPIIIDEDGELMDGRHRIMKAMLTGEKSIKVVKFEINPEPCKIDD